ncbi:hypothetical protein BJF85_01995 [Saccharomonospora sp. CUA-673]|uniref:magnesium transporter n=1 Tax=Saccharomonospora sp. CUA-673 TaxID=1904969 RepID=UPI0009667342|nr:magnesium transporter [Saccharomonospora sp. CUA-673]OLT45191.1 hypothetical protein BJF85_01995 [Saccharomonospora sp. CUA-673]
MASQDEPYWTSDDWHAGDDSFRPLRTETRAKLIAALVVGPVAWVITLWAVGWLVQRTQVIAFGLLVTLGSFAFWMLVLPLLRWDRIRQARRYSAPAAEDRNRYRFGDGRP